MPTEAQSAPAVVQTAVPASAPASPLGGLSGILPFVLMIPLFWFLLIRPQQKQAKERKVLLDSLKKNDQILTIGGVYGTVTAIGDDQVTLRIDDAKDVRIRIARGSIQGVVKSKAAGEEAA